MQVSVEDVSSLTKRLKIVVPQEVVAQKIDKAYQELRSDISIKGFRKGKVPRKILEKSYGEKVRMEVGEKLVQDTYFDALEKTDCSPVVHPEVKSHEFADDGTFIYEAEIDVKPEFELADYKGIEIEMPRIVVTDEAVEEELENLRKEMAPLRNVDDRGIQENDLAVIDFEGFQNGEPMKQVKADNYSVEIGSGRNGKEFEEACIGLQKDEEATRTIRFPADFPNPMLAGKDVDFKIKVRDIKERILPELDDEFAKDVGEEFATLADLKEHIRNKIQKEREDASVGDMTDKIMMKILDQYDFPVPNRLVGYEVSEQIKQLEKQLERQGLTLESAGLSQEKLIGDYTEASEKRVRGDFILKKIAEKEEISLSDEDINKGFGRIANKYNMPITEVKKYFQNRDDLLPFMNELLSEKIIDFLRENAIVKETDEASEVSKEQVEAGEAV